MPPVESLEVEETDAARFDGGFGCEDFLDVFGDEDAVCPGKLAFADADGGLVHLLEAGRFDSERHIHRRSATVAVGQPVVLSVVYADPYVESPFPGVLGDVL